MGIPEWVVIIYFGTVMLIHAWNNGKSMDIYYSFPRVLCNILIWVFILYWGGFWS